MKPVLLILDDWEGRIKANKCWEQLHEFVDVQFPDQPISELADIDIAGVSYIMAIRERTALTDDVFARMPRLRLVLQSGGHAYHIDQEAARNRGIAIALGRRVKAPLVAVPELTLAFMLGLMHRIPEAHEAMKTGGWPLLTGRTLKGRRLGVLGMGRHGSRVAHIAKTAFDMDVVAWDRPGSSSQSTEIPRLPLNELLTTSDVVSIHLRLSKESTGLINIEKLQLMKPGAILINTSRGAIVDERALIVVLTSGHLAGAGMDVFAHEPLDPGSPLRTLNNVMLTPHTGWTVEEVFDEFARIACTQLLQFLEGTLPESEILTG